MAPAIAKLVLEQYDHLNNKYTMRESVPVFGIFQYKWSTYQLKKTIPSLYLLVISLGPAKTIIPQTVGL